MHLQERMQIQRGTCAGSNRIEFNFRQTKDQTKYILNGVLCFSSSLQKSKSVWTGCELQDDNNGWTELLNPLFLVDFELKITFPNMYFLPVEGKILCSHTISTFYPPPPHHGLKEQLEQEDIDLEND